jgi:uncharacterized protein (DUF427 family)
VKATWNGTVIAEGDDTVVEDDHYLPVASVKPEYLKDSGGVTVSE